jgi:DNA-binding NarL/FixJ family response regulator
MNASKTKVAVVEDNDLVRELLVRQLNRTTHLECVGACADAETALKEIPRLKPDVVLMDIRLPLMSGIECTTRLRGLFPRLNIVMLTEHENTELVFEALKAGANGYLLRKHTPARQLENALSEVMKGGSPMTPDVARKVVQYFQQLGGAPGMEKLTKREREVLDCLAQGWLYKEIADRLGISIETARRHLKNIYRKLQVGTRTEAVVKYLRTRS